MKSINKQSKQSKNLNYFVLCFIVFIFLSLFLLSGCSNGFFKGRSEQIQTYDFRQGSEGVSIVFIEDLPPKSTFVGTDLSIGIRLKNQGSFDVINGAELKINAPEDVFLFEEGITKSFTLRGKSLYTKEGEEDVILFPVRAKCFDGYDGTKATTFKKNRTSQLSAIACYQYETIANTDLCIDPNKYLRTASENVACKMSQVAFSGGQGGPVGVTKISPSVVPKSETEATLQLSLSFKKLQGTDVSVYNPRAKCGDAKEQNKVDIDVNLGGRKMLCNPSQVTIKQNGEVSTICKVTINPGLGVFKTPVSVKMNYGVQNVAYKTVVVNVPPGDVSCDLLKN